MRRVGLSDLDAAARALMLRPPPEWPQTARALINSAHLADLFRKRMGRAHPDGGTGSLFVQAQLLGRCEANFAGPDYARAMETVLGALTDWRARMDRTA